MRPSLFLVLVVSSQLILTNSQPEQGWTQFVSKHKKVYSSLQEQIKRKSIFDANLRIIDDMNAQNLGYTVQMNRFADLTINEALRRFTGVSSGMGAFVPTDILRPEPTDEGLDFDLRWLANSLSRKKFSSSLGEVKTIKKIEANNI
jgi:hypothetical protein